VYAQTSTSGTRSSTRSSSSTWRQERKEEQRQGAVKDFVMAVIGGMLRHPDPVVRKQAIQSISIGMVGEEATGGSNEGGVRSLFAVSNERSGGQDDTSTGIGGAVFIPDLYVLLSDPDPEVRDIASVGLDMIFGTDSTLLRLLQDNDPLVRKYATQIFARKRISISEEGGGRSSEEQLAEVRDLLALRTMLVRLKYEKEPEVRKVIQDTLDWYIKYGGDTRNRGGRGEYGEDLFGVSATLSLDYINDPDPEIRKNAIKTIGLRESSDDIMIKLLERLRVEKDESVRQEIQTALDNIRTRQTYDREGRGGGAAGLIR
ncbi:MAG: hypothetical protein NC929_03965, partial [Candidatus Omnitrophica bacterium]|nr:hypothetical protein [Candidatus Omnitrophota bacterium]